MSRDQLQGKSITQGKDYARVAAELLGRRFDGRPSRAKGKARRRRTAKKS